MPRLKIILQSKNIFTIVFILSLIFAFIRIKIIKYESQISIKETTFVGVITKIEYKKTYYKLTIKSKETIIVNYVTKEKINFELGETIKVVGELSMPKNNTIPNTFNYKEYLNNHHIYFILKAKNITHLKANTNVIYKIKNKLYQRIDSYKYNSNYLKTFILGDKTDLDEIDTYQENGVSHLFAISGMHISILSSILLFTLKKFRYKELITILFLVFFALITNYSASIYRSVLFFILLTFNKKYDFNIKTKDVLLLTISLLIVNDSLIIYDMGFQYSALVSYGLIISNKYYKKSYLFNLLLTSLIAFLFSLPITLIYNYEINLLSILNNIIIVPLVNIIVFPLSLLTLLFQFLSPLLKVLITILELINNILFNLKFTIIIPKVSIIFYLIYYVLLFLFIKSNNKIYLLVGLLMILSLKIKPLLSNNIEVYFLDVGQGDSSLIISNKEIILIDTGGIANYNVSDKTIKLIKSLGYHTIDLLLLTHGDSDHMLDSTNIIKKLNVKNVMINNNEKNDLELLIKNPIKNYQSKLNFQIYNEFISKDENASSIISLLNINKINILFMGDATKEQERLFISKYNIKTDIIKLSHHGSKTGSDESFIKQIKPKEAIISCSKNNLYHLPNKEVINILNNNDIKYYETSIYGTIRYLFRQNKYTINYYKP